MRMGSRVRPRPVARLYHVWNLCKSPVPEWFWENMLRRRNPPRDLAIEQWSISLHQRPAEKSASETSETGAANDRYEIGLPGST